MRRVLIIAIFTILSAHAGKQTCYYVYGDRVCINEDITETGVAIYWNNSKRSIDAAKLRAIQNAKDKCKTIEVNRLSNWTRVELYNRYDKPKYRISAKFQCLNDSPQWGNDE